MPLARQFKFEEVPMKKNLKALFILSGAMLLAGAALAKLPALSDEAKAKAAEAAAKTAWTGKLEAFQLCKAQDKVAARSKPVVKGAKPAAPASSCVDPGPFVYVAAVAGAAAPAVAASAVAAKKS
jgi:hypothetical protein